MQWTGLNDVREQFLSFFESKGHLRMPSFPLVPQGDSSLLLINSGMAPLKAYFMGEQKPPSVRVTTCQKCIRTPDIERVGKTSRHGTYFEMLGNFSFGDYFKREAIGWAWEFVTQVIGLPQERVYCSVYLDDDEAWDIWTREIGVAEDHMVRFGKEDNFWEIGSGPCGPCSELYFDRGPEHGCGSPDCKVGCDCDRYVEFWNLVFTQFVSDGAGTYDKMEHPNIDTGMGLERLACILQGVDNLFEVDTVQKIMQHIARIAGVTYKQDEKTDVSLRVITDHIRSTTFMVADGVTPSNEGRGYVLRRLLRRAARHGRLLGIDRPFLSEVCRTVVEENLSAYPELSGREAYIQKVIRIEEERFLKTITQGMDMLMAFIDRLESRREQDESLVLPGDTAFKLYDTFGFPLDLTREILEERAIGVDEGAFDALMKRQREQAREARQQMGAVGWKDERLEGLTELTSEFVGYESLSCEATVLALYRDGERVEIASDGEDLLLVLDKTPFYAESGGQVSDTGTVTAKGGRLTIHDQQKVGGAIVHRATVEEGSLEAGEIVTAAVDEKRRLDIARNHTAAHLLQAALRRVLGDHVYQSGSHVDPDRVRFDFTHFAAVTADELTKIEREVNEAILAMYPVTTRVMSLDEAKQAGALALFSEKYDHDVRVVDIAGYSSELCGGTHLSNTSQAGLFKILSESSVAAGVRRIEGVTGRGVLALIEREHALMRTVAQHLKLGNVAEIATRAASMVEELKALHAEIEGFRSRMAGDTLDEMLKGACEMGGLLLVIGSLPHVRPDELRLLGDRLRDKAENVVALLMTEQEGKTTIAAVCGSAAVGQGLKAGEIVKSIASLCGGSGGGKPDFAMGGVKDGTMLDSVLTAIRTRFSGGGAPLPDDGAARLKAILTDLPGALEAAGQ